MLENKNICHLAEIVSTDIEDDEEILQQNTISQPLRAPIESFHLVLLPLLSLGILDEIEYINFKFFIVMIMLRCIYDDHNNNKVN